MGALDDPGVSPPLRCASSDGHPAYNHDVDACVQLARKERGPRVVKTDLRKPDDDPVFAEALETFVFRRSKCDWHLFPPNVFANAAALEPDGAMWMCVDLSEYMSEVVRALEVAAEAYEFNLDATRKRAAEMLKPIDNKLELDTYLLSAREARVRARGEQQAGV